ncbi:hypothetical protein DL98DRAFT_659727 [Cadophora sp. DSE1049]|nr:hypothetical protein DL98DRAFT_659727 [Cadophora sp. DSE1049]
MVHTGKPSRGCAVCRKRRIKCDEKAPSCSYCIKTKQPCPGYKDIFDLAWRDQNAVAERSVQRRKRAAEKQRAETTTRTSRARRRTSDQDKDEGENKDDEEISTDIERTITTHISPHIPTPLAETPSNYALSFFFSIYANPPSNNDERRGYLEYLAPQFLCTAPNSTLKMATMAVASCLFIAWLNRRADNPTSRAFYLKALKGMKEGIEKERECGDDEMLMSVLLLQFYENLVSRTRASPMPGAHLDGALALIRHRGVETFRDDTSLGLLFQVRSQLIDEAFRKCEPLPPDISAWGSSIPDSSSIPALSRLDNILIHLANLSAHVESFTKSPCHPPPANLKYTTSNFNPQASLKVAISIETQLSEWSSSLSSPWLPVRVTGEECIHPSILQAGLYQPYCDIYPSTNIAYTWNKQRIALMTVLGVQHRILTFVSNSQVSVPIGDIESTTTNEQDCSKSMDLETSLSTIKAKIQHLADSILASIPYLLGSKTQPGIIGDRNIKYPHLPGREIPDVHYRMAPAVGGYFLLGPLRSLLELDLDGAGVLREGQKAWVGGQMGRIARIYNIGK